MVYNWQQSDWPEFQYSTQEIEEALFTFAEETGHTSGIFNSLSEDMQLEAVINTMVAEAIKTSEIEGEYLSRQDVVSSIRNNLGLNKKHELIKDRKAQGIGRLMVYIRDNYAAPLSAETLYAWHEMIMAGNTDIAVGRWRTHEEPMQVVSGAIGKEKVHFEAPPSAQVPGEMERFILWFNDTAPNGKQEIKRAPVRSAIAHLYFETIHPFEDGNGRIGRAIAEKALSQTMGRPVLLSLSRTIEGNKSNYYDALERAQRNNMITKWINYFVTTVVKAQKQTRQVIEFTLKKSRFFEQFQNLLNERQLKVIGKMMDAGYPGFEGGMTANKYISITKISKATATRDLQYLADIKALLAEGGGRNTRYILNLDNY